MGGSSALRLLFIVSLCANHFLPSLSFHTMVRNFGLEQRHRSLSMVSSPILSATEETSFKVVSFNILAPCYNKLSKEHSPDGTSIMEAEFEEKYMARNLAICDQLLQSNADIICLQEYWSGSDKLRDLYKSMLCGPKGAGYTFTEQRRTSHWRMRDDGLACFVKDERIVVQDTRAILFHDCGDRVAQMLLLALRPPIGAPANTPAQQFICVNTHLLFPHNEYSTKIRLRELAKILGFVESYRMRELCSTICGRSDVRLPVIIAGDFNGSPRGAVHRFARSQNYFSAFEEYCKQLEPLDFSDCDEDISEDGDEDNEPIENASENALNYLINKLNTAQEVEIAINESKLDETEKEQERDLLRYDFGMDDDLVSSTKMQNDEISKLLSMNEKNSLNSLKDSMKDSQIDSQKSQNGSQKEKKKSKRDIFDLEQPEPEHEVSASRLLAEIEDKNRAESGFDDGDNSRSSMRSRWISHRSHRQENVPVDHIFYLNPSEQVEKRLPPIPDWTNLVYREIFLRMTENQEIRSIQDIFETFDTANKSFITLEEFKNALVTLGFIGEGKSALTDEEITVLVSCADKDGNGMIDYKEFCDRFWLAANDKEQQQLYSYRFGKKSFFARSNWLSTDLAPKIEEDVNMDMTILGAAGSKFPPSSSSASSSAKKLTSALTITEDYPSKQPVSPLKLAGKISSLSSTFASGAKISLDTRHMADLTIRSARLLPEELEQGVWPAHYTLSDHGMVEVEFRVAALTEEPLINPKPVANKM